MNTTKGPKGNQNFLLFIIQLQLYSNYYYCNSILNNYFRYDIPGSNLTLVYPNWIHYETSDYLEFTMSNTR